jgi:hypothetical protein
VGNLERPGSLGQNHATPEERRKMEESFGSGSYSGDAALYHFKIPKMGLSLENT